MSALFVGPVEIAELRALRQMAAEQPVNMIGLAERLMDPGEKAKHMDQMTAQSVVIPVGFLVTFSIETGHGSGTARHMSMSSPVKGRVPHPAAVAMVMEHLGFAGPIERCVVWPEELKGHEGTAINILEIIETATAEGHA